MKSAASGQNAAGMTSYFNKESLQEEWGGTIGEDIAYFASEG
jgi:hypothetical protein